jgi:hypothetical protein
VKKLGKKYVHGPVVPFVAMIFDDLEVAKQVYNDYAWKLGFGTCIGNNKYSTSSGVPKDKCLNVSILENLLLNQKVLLRKASKLLQKEKKVIVDMSNIGV